MSGLTKLVPELFTCRSFFYIFFAPSTCFVCLFPTLDCGVTTTAPKTSGSPLLKQEDNASYTQNV